MDWGHLQKSSKLLFIADTPGQEEAANRKFATEELELKFVGGSRYLGDYLSPGEELESWVKPQVEAWVHRIKVLSIIFKKHPQTVYYSLGMSLQLN